MSPALVLLAFTMFLIVAFARSTTLRLMAFAAFLTLSACGAQVGPFVPPNPQPCAWEGDCGPGYTCRFPSAGSRAVCMPGDNRLDIEPALPR